jgi:uncharacterized protein (TIGR02118 family)
MIRVNVLYPAREGAHFDFGYYLERHVPMVRDRMQEFGLTGITVDRGLAGLTPETPASYVCIASMTFASTQSVQEGLALHGAEIMGDIPNYTDIQPVIQVAEVRL